MRNKWNCAVAYLFVMVLLAGFVPGQKTIMSTVNAVGMDSSADASGDISGDASSDASGDISTDASADVLVTIADKGNFAVGEDEEHTLMVRTPVHVTDVDEDGALTFNDAMLVTHEQYCKDGYSSSVGEYGLSVTRLWGDESFNFGYYVDDSSAWSPKDSIEEGSDIVAFIHKTKTNTYTIYDNYSYFSQKAYSVKTGEAVVVSLLEQTYDENWNVVTKPCAAATLGVVTVSSENAQFTSIDKVTDASGNAAVSFDKPGTYVLSAREAESAEAAIVPPVCIIHVEEAVAQPPVNQEVSGQPDNSTGTQTQAPQTDNQTPAETPDTSDEASGPDAKAIALQKTKQKISSVKSKKAKQMSVTFKKNKKATGYQVQYSTSKRFTKKTTKKLLVKKTTYTIKKLKRKQTYYVRVRSVRKVNGKNYYGKFSKVKKITVK